MRLARAACLTALTLALLLVLTASRAETAYPHKLSDEYPVGSGFMSAGLRGALRLPRATVDGQPLIEISGLAWDEDESLLYALSDRGWFFHLRPHFDDGILTDVELLSAHVLRDANGDAFSDLAADSEGIVALNHRNGVTGDTQLAISFERRPRIVVFNTRGATLHEHALPTALSAAYQLSNKGFEGIAEVPGIGLVTAPEWPKPDSAAKQTAFHAPDGRSWGFPRYPAPQSSVVAIEAMPDGSLLTLERSYTSVFRPLRIILRQTTPLAATGGELDIQREIAVFNSYRGWQIDNFEGLTLHGPRHVFMVSDDNESWPQKTLLVYLELLDKPAARPPLEMKH